jgi:actin-related protein
MNVYLLRLHSELTARMDSTMNGGSTYDRHSFQNEYRVYPSSLYREPGYTFQRKYAPWIGGSIIGSLNTHSELKISRQEWEEGVETSLWQTKCF